MESINKVEIKGRVGSVRLTEVCGQKNVRMSVATELCYNDGNGSQIIETTWHNVTVWDGPGVDNLVTLKKLDIVHLTGHLRTQGYVDSNGIDRTIVEVVADTLKIENS